jgi:hypothetical protein
VVAGGLEANKRRFEDATPVVVTAVRQVLCLEVEVDLGLTEGSLLLVAGGTEVMMVMGHEDVRAIAFAGGTAKCIWHRWPCTKCMIYEHQCR